MSLLKKLTAEVAEERRTKNQRKTLRSLRLLRFHSAQAAVTNLFFGRLKNEHLPLTPVAQAIDLNVGALRGRSGLGDHKGIRSNKYKSNITTDTKKRLVKPHFVKAALVGHSAVGHSEVCEQALFQVAKGQS